jgi:hypothetical protein
MSLPTTPYLLYDNQYPMDHDAFGPDALTKRFGYYAPCVKYPCKYNPVDASNPDYIVSPPCCPEMAGVDVLGIGTNQGVLDYQFGSSMDVPFCGVPMQNTCHMMPGAPTPTNCEKCPCTKMGCHNVGGKGSPKCCDYGFARTHSSVFGPNGGNRYGNMKWG